MIRVNENEKEFRNGDNGPKYLERGPRIDWGVLVLKPGQTLGKHYHNEVQETFFFLEGEPLVKVNDEEYRVKVGDVFIMEEGDKHDIKNDTDSHTKMVFIKCPYCPKDKVDC